MMLTLTDNAVAAIRDLTSQPDVPDGSGVRIGTDPAAGSLMLSLAQEPIPGDQVVDVAGATVFLDSDAAPLVEEQALDATVDDTGLIEFTLAPQPD
jgi:iron-sulfur cluster assembly protein